MDFGAVVFALCAVLAVAPIRRPHWLGAFSWFAGSGPSQAPILFAAIVAASTIPGFIDGGPVSWTALVLTVVSIAALGVCLGRALRTRPTVDRALDDALGARWRDEIHPDLRRRLRRHLPWWRIVSVPWPFGRRDVVRIADIPYAAGGEHQLLDVFRHRSLPDRAPTLVYFHGGHFRSGRKNREARALVHHLSCQGWTCISANYRLSATPAAGFPGHLIDVKRVISWARGPGRQYGVDPDMIVVAGSSAGAHLTAMAALTANNPDLQPGFEAADTSVAAGIGLYGYYGELGPGLQPPSSPLTHAGPHAPPMFVIHGANDTLVPPDGARRLAERLRTTSAQPVVYAELPGAQHTFDLLHSVCFETVIDAIEAFAAWVRSDASHRQAAGVSQRSSPAADERRRLQRDDSWRSSATTRSRAGWCGHLPNDPPVAPNPPGVRAP